MNQFTSEKGTKRIVELFLGKVKDKEGELMEEITKDELLDNIGESPHQDPVVPNFYGFTDGESVVITKHVEGETDVIVEGSYNVDGTDLSTKLTNDSSNLFTGDNTVKTVTFEDGVDSSELTSTSGMFKDCTNLETVDLSKVDMSNIDDMSSMFENTSNLQEVTVNDTINEGANTMDMFKNSNTDTVTKASGDTFSVPAGTYEPTPLRQFNYTIIDDVVLLNSIQTAAAYRPLPTTWVIPATYDIDGTTYQTRLGSVFSMSSNTDYRVQFIKDVVIEDGVEIWNFYNFFQNCKSLETVEIGRIVIDPTMDTSNTTDIGSSAAYTKNKIASFFASCSALVSIKGIENLCIDGVNLRHLAAIFYGCSALQSIDLSGFKFGDDVVLYNLFNGCTNLQSIVFPNTEITVYNICQAFSNCTNLGELNLTSFNTAAATPTGVESTDYSQYQQMVYRDKNLTRILVNPSIWTIPASSTSKGALYNSSVTEYTYV